MSVRSRLGALAARPMAWLRARQRAASCPGEVCYFPPFATADDLTSHYHRALWYLPWVEGHCTAVRLFARDHVAPSARPGHFCDDAGESDHVQVVHAGLWRNLRALWRSRLVVVWSKAGAGRWVSLAGGFGFPVVDVETDDPEAVEYGTYCSLLWKYLTEGRERYAIRQDNTRRFSALAERVRARQLTAACVFGTGPTLEEADGLCFSNCLTVACNSIVQNPSLLDQLDPTFIAAGDVVSHFGVSAYAGKFRADLIRTLGQRDCVFIATDSFGYLLTVNHPEIADRTILVPQTCDGPNFDLIENFSAPKLDSVLNILMLPLAATFCDNIYLLGCDGKSPKRDNEDFWAHASGAQYDDLVDTGHRCHPTFDINRQQTTHDRYNRSIAETVRSGERGHGKSYACLRQSYTPVLSDRTATSDQLHRFGGRSGPE